MTGLRSLCIGVCWVAALWPAGTHAAHLRGRILSVGFSARSSSASLDFFADEDSASVPANFHCRAGAWTPVCVELTNDDADRFDGRIEVRQQDADGDDICASRDVAVQGTRRFFLYVPAEGRQTRVPFPVRVYDAAGQLAPLHDDSGAAVRELTPVTPVSQLPPEALVVLDISPIPLNSLQMLLRRSWELRPLVIARSSPAELPDDAVGLDMADIIVWDATDPSAIDLPQRNALIEWVRRGGTLVLSAGKNWDVLSKSRFADVLPVVLHPPQSMTDPPPWLGEWMGMDPFGSRGGRFSPALVYNPITERDLLPGAGVVVPTTSIRRSLTESREDPPGANLLFAVRRSCGLGSVVLTAAEIQALVGPAENPARPLADIVGLRLNLARPGEEVASFGYRPANLFEYIRQMTAFSVTAWLYMLLALIFVSVYILVAGPGSWRWLANRGQIKHAWLAFAGVAVVASLVSVAAVRAVRGIRYSVQEFSVVDGMAGDNEVGVCSYWGLKAPGTSRLDLRVPADWRQPDRLDEVHPMLRPMPSASKHDFKVTDRYESLATLGTLRSVPLRATLKQFESQWRGPLDGQVTGSLLRVGSNTGELAPASWIENSLATDLTDCWLLVTWRNPDSMETNRVTTTLAYPFYTLAHGRRVTIAELTQVAAADRLARDPQAGASPPGRIYRTLSETLEKDWLRALTFVSSHELGYGEDFYTHQVSDNFARACRIMSIFQEVPMDGIDQSQWRQRIPITASWGQRLDRSEQLTCSSALFIGIGRSPGPTRLCYRPSDNPKGRWRAIEPAESNVVYRFLIPVSLAGSVQDSDTP